MTDPSNTSVTAQFGAGERGEPFTPRDAWDELVHKDDRTSPEDYPDMCLITFEELRDFMDRAAPVSHTSVKDGGEATTPWECMGRKQSLPEPGECNWPDCGCDPHATKVIESLLEQGWGPK